MRISKMNCFLRRSAAAVLCLIMLAGAAPTAKAEGEIFLSSEAAVLMDAETGQVLYAKNADEVLYPASITKVMTGMIALKELDPDTIITMSQDAVNAVPRTSSHISLQPGEEMTLEQAMYAIGMESANDAANGIAEAVSGSLAEFGTRMTEEAHLLGAYNTHFTNANGLPDSEHYTTAYDMALITSAALKVPGLTQYFSTLNYEFPATNKTPYPRSFVNKNRMLPGAQYAYEGVLMSKTGWTSSAQGTLVTAVRRGDTTLVAVTMKSVLLEDKYRDTVTLMEYGFTRFARTPVSGSKIAKQLELNGYVPAKGQKLSYLLPVDANPDDIVFSLAEGMDLSRNSEQTAVLISARLGDMELSDNALVLVRRKLDLFSGLVQVFQEEEADPEEVSEEINLLQLFFAVGSVLLLFAAELELHRRRERRHRRRRLEGRIRQMKKQMEE